MQIQALAGNHNRQAFDSGRQELNDWLKKIARQHQEKGLSKTYIATDDENSGLILAYYALTLSEIDHTYLPESHRKNFPRRIPGVKLGRLAVHKDYQGKKLGELLLVDALMRTRRIYNEAGGIGLFVDALDLHAAAYYRRFGFEATPDHPLMLFLSVNF
jgi:GNAT superfamily N-acetyltransferase